MKSEWVNHGGFRMTLITDGEVRAIKFIFDKPVEWFTMDAQEARKLAAKLIENAKELEAK